MNDDARLRWQCRRGMRELDVLLSEYLLNRYPNSSAAKKSAFRQLLALSDPELISYLLGQQIPARPELSEIVSDIRSHTTT